MECFLRLLCCWGGKRDDLSMLLSLYFVLYGVYIYLWHIMGRWDGEKERVWG